MEEWREISGTEYSVSNEGRVASRKFAGWRVLRPAPNKGYLQVCLSLGGKGRGTRMVHLLVAEAFLGPRPTPTHQANHIDGIRANNRVINLEWVTNSENQHHRYDVLKHGAPRGEKNGRAKLTEAQVHDIRGRRLAGERRRVIAAEYGVSMDQITDISRRDSWAWLDAYPKYPVALRNGAQEARE